MLSRISVRVLFVVFGVLIISDPVFSRSSPQFQNLNDEESKDITRRDPNGLGLGGLDIGGILGGLGGDGQGRSAHHGGGHRGGGGGHGGEEPKGHHGGLFGQGLLQKVGKLIEEGGAGMGGHHLGHMPFPKIGFGFGHHKGNKGKKPVSNQGQTSSEESTTSASSDSSTTPSSSSEPSTTTASLSSSTGPSTSDSPTTTASPGTSTTTTTPSTITEAPTTLASITTEATTSAPVTVAAAITTAVPKPAGSNDTTTEETVTPVEWK